MKISEEMKQKIEVARANIIIVTSWLTAAIIEETEILNNLIIDNDFYDEENKKITDIENIHCMDDESCEVYKIQSEKTQLKNATGKICRYKKSLTKKENTLIDLVLEVTKDSMTETIDPEAAKKNIAGSRNIILNIGMKMELATE